MLYPQFRRNVRILLLGERSVGKTSIILSLVSEEFPGEGGDEDLPAKSEEITIPADVTPEFVPTTIVDFSAQEQDETELALEIAKAHVICIIYAVNDDESLEKVTTYWLPTVQRVLGGGSGVEGAQTVPVILVGNKIDAVDYTTMDIVVPLMSEWPEIETCIECSAKTLRNISELFFYAQKAVLHPTRPIYDCDRKELTRGCRAALERIFRICDTNNDGVLDDMEMYHFQKTCYDAPLQPQALDSVKLIIQQYDGAGVRDGGITLAGFLTLHTIFVQRGKHETTWTALRKFGYNDRLEICNDYLCPLLGVPLDAVAELNQAGLDYFTALFVKYDLDRDRCLSPQELQALFSTCPTPPPFARGAHAYSRLVPVAPANGYLTYGGWMCAWVLTTLLDVNQTMEYMAYTGFPIDESENQSRAVAVVPRGQGTGKRTVYKCHVIGSRGVGKTTICERFIGAAAAAEKNEEEPGPSSIKSTTVAVDGNTRELSNYVINMVQVYGQDKYLVLQDIDLARVVDILPARDTLCDVVCLVYDTSDPKSFEFIARTYLNYYASSKIPVLIVGNKTDRGQVLQEYALQPAAFCSKYKLPPPHFCSREPPNGAQSSAPSSRDRELFIKLATMGAFPRFQPAWMLFYQGGAGAASLLLGSSSGAGGPGARSGSGGGTGGSVLKWVSTIGLGVALVTSVFFITAKIWPAPVGTVTAAGALEPIRIPIATPTRK